MGSRTVRAAQRLFGSGPFGRLAVLHSVTNAADALFTVSLAGSLFFAVSADPARPRIPLSLLLALAPFAVLGAFIAPVIDRGSGGYRLVILATSLLRAGAGAAIAFSPRPPPLFP